MSSTRKYIEYKEQLQAFVDQHGCIPDRADPGWFGLLALLQQDKDNQIITHAKTQGELVVSLIGSYMRTQDVKVDYHIELQSTPANLDDLLEQHKGPPKTETAYKAHSRLIAIRIVVPAHVDIGPVSEAIQTAVKNSQVKNNAQYTAVSYATPNSVTYNETGRVSDIVNFIRFYCSPVGYMVRLQIAPAFVFHVFDENKKAASDMLQKQRKDDLWKLYEVVKQAALDPTHAHANLGSYHKETPTVDDAVTAYSKSLASFYPATVDGNVAAREEVDKIWNMLATMDVHDK